MAGLNKIETYLYDLGISYEEVGKETWLIDDPAKGLPRIVVSLNDPVVVVRVNVMEIPDSGREPFFRKLLELNGEGLVHGAYAIEDGRIVLVDTLEYGTMDRQEFEASIDAIGFALSEHGPLLSGFVTKS